MKLQRDWKSSQLKMKWPYRLWGLFTIQIKWGTATALFSFTNNYGLGALNFFKNNDKETKEHNMIVDMERNDLSRICKPGTVKISKKKYVEEYKHLFHYVTTIQGLLKNKTRVKNIIKSMMPGGSVIGCPKIRTLELLNKQETEDRNIFTGSFGYIKFNQDMRFNIIIRSILNYKNISEISAASGVVLDSSPKKEFN